MNIFLLPFNQMEGISVYYIYSFFTREFIEAGVDLMKGKILSGETDKKLKILISVFIIIGFFLSVLILKVLNNPKESTLLNKESTISNSLEPVEQLPTVGNVENLKRMLEEYHLEVEATMRNRAQAALADYCRTNIQVEGVDESDIVKCDGRYIYKVFSGEKNDGKGLKLKGAISHYPDGEKIDLYSSLLEKRRIDRILYIGSNLYTISDSYIKVNDIKSLKEKGKLSLQ
jgi:uncharacterized secreted protein with C-terminal beta-propeller domain